MRYAIIRGYRMAGPLHEYSFGEFSHETPQRVVTKDSVCHRQIHSKNDLVCLCETKAQAESICSGLNEVKAEYLRRVDAASDCYTANVEALIAKAREEAEQLTMEVEAPRPLRRAREFRPQVIDGGRP